MRERSHHHDVALADATVGDGGVKRDRDGHGEQVAAFVERVRVMAVRQFERLTPIAQDDPAGLIGDEPVEIRRRDADLVGHLDGDFGHHPVAPGEHLRDLGG